MLIKIVKRRVMLRILIVSFVFIASYGFSVNFINEISPRNVERPKRKKTMYIVLHTTEAPDKSSLSSLKRYGEANYMVSTGGTVYRIIDHNRVAYHAGVSMWNGRTHLDKFSLGIEVVGYHNKSITQSQYTTLKSLISELQGMYGISDKNVLTHSMVAYGVPNKWHKYKHRGRKRCGMQFATDSVRYKLGLTDRYLYDPDVRAGRLRVADSYLQSVLYRKRTSLPQSSNIVSVDELSGHYETYVIIKGKSPWDIVGLNSKMPGTLYIFPDGQRYFAKDIKNWSKIPVGTKILVKKGVVITEKQFVSPKKVVSKKQNKNNKVANVELSNSFISFNGSYDTNIIVKGKSPWDIVGYKCKSDGTIYIFPDGKKCMAQDIKSWSKIPIGTKIIVPQEASIIDAANIHEEIVNEKIIKIVTDVSTNVVVQEQVDIIIEKAIDTSASYIFIDALSGNSIVLSERDLLSSNNVFLVNGGIKQGNQMSLEDLQKFNSETKILIGYEQKGILGGQKSAFDLVSYHWNQKDTVYYLSDKNKIITGDKIDERSMSKGTYLLLKK